MSSRVKLTDHEHFQAIDGRRGAGLSVQDHLKTTYIDTQLSFLEHKKQRVKYVEKFLESNELPLKMRIQQDFILACDKAAIKTLTKDIFQAQVIVDSADAI
jgi:hypothetical protein